jgi:hypothetical protein
MLYTLLWGAVSLGILKHNQPQMQGVLDFYVLGETTNKGQGSQLQF